MNDSLIRTRVMRAAEQIPFSALGVTRDPTTGRVVFDIAVLRHFCELVGLTRAPETDDEQAMVLCAWYQEVRAAGGRPQHVMEELSAQMRRQTP